jgi:hypothetical protein
MPKPAAENARDDEPTEKVEHQDRVKMEDGHDEKRLGVTLGPKPGVVLQHNDDGKMGKPTGSKGKETHAQAMSFGWLGDLSWFNDDMQGTSMSSSGDDELKGDAERPSKNSGQLQVRGISSCPPDTESSALTALQLLAKGINTGCALSPAEWAKITKFKKEEAKGGTKKKKAAALKKAAMKKRKAAALKKAAIPKASSKKVAPKSKAAMTKRKAAAVSKPAASAPIVATPTASASATDAAAFATFIHREYSKTYHRIKTELMRGGFSKDDAAARGSDAARQHVADLRQQREEKLHS